MDTPQDAGPQDVGPEDVGPEDVGPEDVGPEDVGPEDVGPEDVGPEDVGPEDVGPADAGPGDTAPEDIAEPDVPPSPPPPTWDPLPEALPCPVDSETPALDAVLALTDLEKATFGYTLFDFEQSTKYYLGGLLEDLLHLTWQRDVLFDPAHAPCFARDQIQPLDAMETSAHPAATAIRHTAQLMERWKAGEPLDPTAQGSLEDAIASGCAAAGQTCPIELIELPEELRAALTPIFWAMADGLAARKAMTESAPFFSADTWVAVGGAAALAFAPYNELPKPGVVEHLSGLEHRPAVNLAAARIAYAIEAVDWTQFAGQLGVTLDLETPLGWIRIRDALDDTYPQTDDQTWLLLDLGGNDIHEDDVGATGAGSYGVSVAIDLGGDDIYAYEVVPSEFDQDYLLPSDDGGRYEGSDTYGHCTLSKRARQGAGRNGIGMLFDLGGGDDSYTSLRMSQGYAHLGVGLLYDDGGTDTYTCENACQGSSGYGIGLLIDRGDSNDQYKLYTHGQGSGDAGGAGVLYDEGGDDTYFADPGDAQYGGNAVYYSIQNPGKANSSAAQGASLGLRWDAQNLFLSGGVGLLRDKAGNDQYTCSVWCQGSGFWQGTGILSDGDGSDVYEMTKYSQGGGAHYAIGLSLDGGAGDDTYNKTFAPIGVGVGSGHDFTLGMLINDGGNDYYRSSSYGLGGSHCNGIGVLVDNGGDDTYDAMNASTSGFGNLGACKDDPDRPKAVSIGVQLDVGGADTYLYPMVEYPAPTEGGAWGHTGSGQPTEHGAGLDTPEGDAGIHVQ